jgi:hypothetical protein
MPSAVPVMLARDAVDLAEHLRRVDLAVLRRDADHQHILGAENILDPVGGDHIRVRLRQEPVGIDLDPEFADLAKQYPGDDHHRDEHCDSIPDDHRHPLTHPHGFLLLGKID